MNQENKFTQIAEAARSGNVQDVRMHLINGVDYRQAYLYVEGFFPDDKSASALIQLEGKCKCGNVASRWEKRTIKNVENYSKGICTSCSFAKAMDKIEYGPAKPNKMQRKLEDPTNSTENYTRLEDGQCKCGEKVTKVVDSDIVPFKKDGIRYHYPEATDSWCIFRCKTCNEPIHETWIEIIATKYCRLLSYENALKVIEFINKNDKADYANVTPGGISMQVSGKNWVKVEAFIKSLNVRYEIGAEAPHKVVDKIVVNLKKANTIN